MIDQEEQALYNFLLRKQKTEEKKKLFKLWWKISGKKQYADAIK